MILKYIDFNWHAQATRECLTVLQTIRSRFNAGTAIHHWPKTHPKQPDTLRSTVFLGSNPLLSEMNGYRRDQSKPKPQQNHHKPSQEPRPSSYLTELKIQRQIQSLHDAVNTDPTITQKKFHTPVPLCPASWDYWSCSSPRCISLNRWLRRRRGYSDAEETHACLWKRQRTWQDLKRESELYLEAVVVERAHGARVFVGLSDHGVLSRAENSVGAEDGDASALTASDEPPGRALRIKRHPDQTVKPADNTRYS